MRRSKVLSLLLAVIIAFNCISVGIIAYAATNITIVYHDKNAEKADFSQTINATSITFATTVNGSQVKNYYLKKDNSRFLPRDSYTFSAEDYNADFEVNVEYEDIITVYHNYNSGVNSDDGLAPATAVNSAGSGGVTTKATTYKNEDAIRFVLMGGVSCKANMLGAFAPVGKTDATRFVGWSGVVDTNDNNPTATGKNILPAAKFYNDVIFTSNHNGFDYTSCITSGRANQTDVYNEIYPINGNITLQNVGIHLLNGHNWLILDNPAEDRKVIFDNVFYVEGSTAKNDLASIPVYRVNDLKANGLTIRYVDEHGSTLATDYISSDKFKKPASSSMDKPYLDFTNKSKVMVYVNKPDITAAQSFYLNGDEINFNNGFEMISTESDNKSLDVIEITVERDASQLVEATVNDSRGNTSNITYIVHDGAITVPVTLEGLGYTSAITPQSFVNSNMVQVLYYDYNGKRYFAGDSIPISAQEQENGITINATVAEPNTVYLFHNTGGTYRDNSNNGLSPKSAKASQYTVNSMLNQFSGYKVVLVEMANVEDSAVDDLNAYYQSGEKVSNSTISYSAYDCDLTASGKSLIYYANNLCDLTITAKFGGVDFGSRIYLSSATTDLALGNNVTFENIDVYYRSVVAPNAEVTVYSNGYYLTIGDNVNTNIVPVESKGIKSISLTYVDEDTNEETSLGTVKVELDADGNGLFKNTPTTINSKQVSYYKAGDNYAFPLDRLTIPKNIVNDSNVKVYYKTVDLPTYFVNANCASGGDGLSPNTALSSLLSVKNALATLNCTAEDTYRIVVMQNNETGISAMGLGKYYADGYKLSVASKTATNYIEDSNSNNGKSANIFGNVGGFTQPKLIFTGKYNNIDYNSSLNINAEIFCSYNDVTFESIGIYTSSRFRYYSQGNNLTIDKNCHTNECPLQAIDDIDTGIFAGYTNIEILAAGWGNKTGDRNYIRPPQGAGTYSPTITIEACSFGRVLGGARVGSCGTEEHPFSPTMNIGGTARVSLICGGQADSTFIGNAEVNVYGEANVHYLVGGTLGFYKAGTSTRMPNSIYYNEYHGTATINVRENATIDHIHGGSVGRYTSSVANFGDITINISGGVIEECWGGSASGIVYGDITTNISGGEIGTLYGGGQGKSPYVSEEHVFNYSKDDLINMGNVGYKPNDVDVINEAINDGNIVGGRVTVNMTGGHITGNLFGGGDGYLYATNEYYNVAQIYNGTSVSLTGTAHVNGSIYGGGDGFEESQLIALVYPETQVYLGPDAVIVEGSVYGGGNNGAVKGNANVTVEGATVYGNIFGAGANSETSGNTFVTIIGTEENPTNIMGNVFGGGELGHVGGASSISITGATITGNIIGGGEDGNVENGATINISDSTVIGNIVGGGEDGVVNGPTSVTVNNTTVSPNEAGDGGCVYGGSINGDVNGNSSVIIKGSSTIGDVYGGAEHGTVNGNANVTINGSVSIGNIYGGGENGDVKGNTGVSLNGSTAIGNIYGGGKTSTVFGDSSVDIKTGNITGDIYGGCEYGNINGSTNVNISENSQIEGSVYGGGYHGNVLGSTDTTIENSSITGSVIGGGNQATVNDGATVSISNTTVGENIIGGGVQGTVNGNVTINLSDMDNLGTVYDGGYGAGASINGSTYINIENCEQQNDKFIYVGGGDGSVLGDVHISKDDSEINFKVSETNPERTPDTFKGWYLTKNGESEEFSNVDNLYGNTKFGTGQLETGQKLHEEGDYTLTMTWTYAHYQINYHSGLDGVNDEEIMQYNYAFASIGRYLRENQFENADKKFIGWSTTPNATTPEYYDKQFVNFFNEAPDGYIDLGAPFATVDLYAVWSEFPPIVIKDLYALQGDTVIFKPVFEKDENKTYSYQWYKDGAPIAGATSENLEIQNVTVDYADYNYYVVITDSDDLVGTSNSAKINVYDKSVVESYLVSLPFLHGDYTYLSLENYQDAVNEAYSYTRDYFNSDVSMETQNYYIQIVEDARALLFEKGIYDTFYSLMQEASEKLAAVDENGVHIYTYDNARLLINYYDEIVNWSDYQTHDNSNRSFWKFIDTADDDSFVTQLQNYNEMISNLKELILKLTEADYSAMLAAIDVYHNLDKDAYVLDIYENILTPEVVTCETLGETGMYRLGEGATKWKNYGQTKVDNVTAFLLTNMNWSKIEEDHKYSTVSYTLNAYVNNELVGAMSNTVAFGDSVTLNPYDIAQVSNSAEFVYWRIQYEGAGITNKLYTSESSYTLKKLAKNVTVNAYLIAPDGENTCKVQIINNDKNVIDTFYAPAGSTISGVETNTVTVADKSYSHDIKSGFNQNGWSVTGDDAGVINGDVVIKACYSPIVTGYPVTVIGDQGKVSNVSFDYESNCSVEYTGELSADEEFYGWAVKTGESSYAFVQYLDEETPYSFRVHGKTELVAVTSSNVDELFGSKAKDIKAGVPFAVIKNDYRAIDGENAFIFTNNFGTSAKSKLTFICQNSGVGSNDYTVVDYGIVYTTKTDVTWTKDNFKYGTAGVNRGSATSTNDAGQYTVSISSSKDLTAYTFYARAYVSYTYNYGSTPVTVIAYSDDIVQFNGGDF